LNKKEAETLLILTNFLHDLWQGFKAMVLVGSCIVVIRLALQMLGTVATVGIFVALPVLYALLWAALSREAFDSGRVSIEKIYNLEKAENKENDPDNKEDE
jgi:hypothetical protein